MKRYADKKLTLDIRDAGIQVPGLSQLSSPQPQRTRVETTDGLGFIFLFFKI